MKCRSNSRLYISKDKYKEGVFFAKTDYIKFCRFYQNKDLWEIWFYPWKMRKRESSLTETLNIIDRYFKKFWEETYAVHN